MLDQKVRSHCSLKCAVAHYILLLKKRFLFIIIYKKFRNNINNKNDVFLK